MLRKYEQDPSHVLDYEPLNFGENIHNITNSNLRSGRASATLQGDFISKGLMAISFS